MSTQNKDQAKTEESHSHDVPGHVHGPNCHHSHHVASVIRQTPKVGRNDECPCGSKQKFKKCCGK